MYILDLCALPMETPGKGGWVVCVIGRLDSEDSKTLTILTIQPFNGVRILPTTFSFKLGLPLQGSLLFNEALKLL
jgi:hypothetical protein